MDNGKQEEGVFSYTYPGTIINEQCDHSTEMSIREGLRDSNLITELRLIILFCS